MQRMRSYLVYTAVLHEDRSITDSDKWKEIFFVDRLRDTLTYWKDCMDKRFMAHPFLPYVNLIEGWKGATYVNNSNRLKRILRKQAVFDKVFKS